MTRLNQRIENFNKAFNIFSLSVDAYISNKENVVMHMALIQSFEICFELSWKVLKDYLKEQKGIIALSPKDAIKEAFSVELIKNGQLWVDMLQDRNTSSHEYNIDKIDNILNSISTIYYNELKEFKKWLDNVK
mgnify:CR=1 FL=1